ncbi:MAG: hypothetical protein ACRD5M_05775 [Candidatus Acidiferrales bacterium]
MLRKWVSSRPVAIDGSERSYNALLAALGRLDPPKFGDALLFFGHHNDSDSSADPAQLLEMILERKVSLLGQSFFDPLRGKLTIDDFNKPLSPSQTALTSSKLVDMTGHSGYYFSFRSAQNIREHGLFGIVQSDFAGLYAGMAEPYRLRIKTSGIEGRTRLEITIKNLDARKIHPVDIHYPLSIYTCTAQPAAP